MAVDITLLNANSVDNINTNFERVATALQDTVGRSGTLPNELAADLDLDGNDILNVGTIQAEDITIDGTNSTGILERALEAAVDAEASAALALTVVDTFPTGGDTGFALVKASVADYDYTWADVSGGFVPNISVADRTALKALDTTTVNAVILKEDGRQGIFIWTTGDFTDRIASDPGEAVYIKATAIAASVGAWVREFQGPVWATWFGVVEGDSDTLAAGNDTPLEYMRDFIASEDNPYKRCDFASGYYWFNNFPNCAIRSATFWPNGEVHLRYNGTGDAITLDGLAAIDGGGTIINEGIRHLTWGPFIIEAKTTALNGIVIRSCHMSHIHPHVKGAGASSAGIVIEWCVCTNFYPYCSGNGDGWYLGARPTYGMLLDKTYTLGSNYVPPSYCNFYNPVFELAVVGLYALWSNGNIFYGGTMEGNTSVGASLDTNCQYTRFYGTDFEANGVYDVDITGDYNEFHGIESLIETVIESAAKENKFIGGSYEKISCVATGANMFNGVSFNRTGSGYLTDTGGKAVIDNCFDTANSTLINSTPTNAAVTVGISPFTVSNTSNNDQEIIISGGGIIAVSYTPRGGVSLDTGVTRIMTLHPGDALTVTYSVAPTIRRVSN